MKTETQNGIFSLSSESRNRIRGVGAIVLNADHEVLVGTEFLAKKGHGRQVGQISIPMETLKPFERNTDNALRLAALSEIMTSENIDRLRQNLREVAVVGPVPLNGEGIEGAISVFHWTGEVGEMPFLPAVPGEFGNFRWMQPGVALNLSNIRPFASIMLQYAESQGLLNGLASRPVPLLDKLNVERYAAIRDDKVDIGNS